jgi:cytochrome P450
MAATSRSEQPGFDSAAFARHFDHHAPEFGEHMDRIFHYMREHCPVARTDAHGGFRVLTRYADIVRVVRDDETFSIRAGMSIPAARSPDDPPFALPGELDPPQSFAYRRIMEPIVSPGALKRLTPWMRSLANRLIDDFIADGKADLVADLAAPLTAIVTLRLAGLQEDEWPQYLGRWQGEAGRGASPEDARARALEGFMWTRNAFADAIAAQRRTPVAGCLIARMLDARIDDRVLRDDEMLAMMINFVGGGLETTQALLGSAWVYLGRDAAVREELRSNPALLPAAVEEMLRLFAPQPGLARVATCDTVLSGEPIREGERVLMCWPAGNRDPAVFPHPDTLDIHRRPNHHVTFGMGAHRCLGANLARLEARVCIEEVLRRLPDYQLEEAGLQRIAKSSDLLGYLSVPVIFVPGQREG